MNFVKRQNFCFLKKRICVSDAALEMNAIKIVQQAIICLLLGVTVRYIFCISFKNDAKVAVQLH